MQISCDNVVYIYTDDNKRLICHTETAQRWGIARFVIVCADCLCDASAADVVSRSSTVSWLSRRTTSSFTTSASSASSVTIASLPDSSSLSPTTETSTVRRISSSDSTPVCRRATSCRLATCRRRLPTVETRPQLCRCADHRCRSEPTQLDPYGRKCIGARVRRLFVLPPTLSYHSQVGTRPDGRCDMRPSRIITDYRLSQKRSISVDVNRSTFEEDMRERRLLHFRSQ